MRGQQNNAVLTAISFEPFPDLALEHRVPQHDPSFIEHEQAGLADKRLFNPVEQVIQHRNQVGLTHFHEAFDLEHHKPGQLQIIGLGIEQVAQGTEFGVMAQRLFQLLILNHMPKICQAAHVLRVMAQGIQGLVNSVSVPRQDRHLLQLSQVGNPIGCKSKFFLRLVNTLERGKGEGITANVVVISIGSSCQGIHGQALVKDKDG